MQAQEQSKSALTLYIKDVKFFSTYREESSEDPEGRGNQATHWAVEMRITTDPQRQAELRERIIYSGLKWVLKVAGIMSKHFTHNSSLAREDLIQQGNVGLIIAADKYNPDMGTTFSTYATWWIKQSIGRWIEENYHIIRKPTYLQTERSSLKNMLAGLERQLEKSEQTLVEINTAKARLAVLESKFAATETVSLSSLPHGGRNGQSSQRTLEDILPSDSSSTERLLGKISDKKVIEKIIDFLRRRFNRRDVSIFILRMGWGSKTQEGYYTDEEETLDAIGRMHRVGKERVRQICEGICKRPDFRWFVQTEILGIIDYRLVNNNHSEPAPTKPKGEIRPDIEDKLELIITLTCRKLALNRRLVLSFSKDSASVEGRKIIAWLGYYVAGAKMKEISFLFNMSISGGDGLVKRCRKLIDADAEIKRIATELEDEFLKTAQAGLSKEKTS